MKRIITIVLLSSMALPVSADDDCFLGPQPFFESDSPALVLSASKIAEYTDTFGLNLFCDWPHEGSRCYENLLGGVFASNPDGAYGRILRAINAMDRVPFWGQAGSWADMAASKIWYIEPVPGCDTSLAEARGAAGELWVWENAHTTEAPWFLGAVLAHESRHFDPGHSGHVDNCPAGPNRCDHAYTDEGPFQWTAAYLAQFGKMNDGAWGPVARLVAMDEANQVLRSNFEVDPGFMHYMTDDGHLVSWKYQDTVLRQVPSPDQLSPYAIQRVDVHLGTHPLPGGGHGLAVLGINVRYRRITSTGALGDGFNVSTGELVAPTDVNMDGRPDWILQIDASTRGPNRLLTGFRIATVPIPQSFSGSPLPFVSVLGVAQQLGPDGPIDNGVPFFAGGGDLSGCGCGIGEVCVMPSTLTPCAVLAAGLDAQIVQPPNGHVMVGISFGHQVGQSELIAEGSFRMPPPYLPQIGGDAYDAELTECPPSYAPIGVFARSEPDGEVHGGVGGLGLYCALESAIFASGGPGASEVALVHPELHTSAGVFPAATAYGLVNAAAVRDAIPGGIIAQCLPQQVLTGLEGRGTSVVHQLKGLRCRDASSTTHERLVSIGTSQFGLPVVQQCPTGQAIHRLPTRRGTGETLVAFAPSCHRSRTRAISWRLAPHADEAAG